MGPLGGNLLETKIKRSVVEGGGVARAFQVRDWHPSLSGMTFDGLERKDLVRPEEQFAIQEFSWDFVKEEVIGFFREFHEQGFLFGCGVTGGVARVPISHLLFVNDILVCCRIHKTIWCKVVVLLSSYLGLPLGALSKSMTGWDGVEERFHKRGRVVWVLNVSLLNKALLCKWCWHFVDERGSMETMGNGRRVSFGMTNGMVTRPCVFLFFSFALAFPKKALVVDEWDSMIGDGGWNPMSFRSFNDWKLDMVESQVLQSLFEEYRLDPCNPQGGFCRLGSGVRQGLNFGSSGTVLFSDPCPDQLTYLAWVLLAYSNRDVRNVEELATDSFPSLFAFAIAKEAWVDDIREAKEE
ncbi:hypothetical protein AAG906_027762 [Vitis piasezkii]